VLNEKIAGYTLLEKISENGPISVYKAEHQLLKRLTLLKVYRGADKKLIERFKEEARTVADINSENIVAIYDFGHFGNDIFFISMEYVDGGNLRDLLENKPEVTDLLTLFAHLAFALSILHQKEYVHRDLKPENILVTLDGEIKITDFGISFSEALDRVTPQGALLGTPLYMSPEQINNEKVTTQSDLFALGIIYHELCSGIHPFRAETYGEIFSNILSVQPAKLSQINSKIPLWFSDLVDKLLQKSPSKRAKSVAEVLQIFNENLSISFPEKSANIDKSFKWRFYTIPASLILILLIFYGLDNNDLNNKALVDSTLFQQKVDSISAGLQSPFNSRGTDNSLKDISDNQNALQEIKVKNIPVSQTTGFFINTFPWCRVYLDYKLLDTTPFKDTLEVRPGKYILSLQNPSYPSWIDTIIIEKGKTNLFSYNLDSLYYIIDLTVYPWGKVYIDDNFIGITPLNKTIFVSRKNKTLRIENEYYQTYQDTLTWHNGIISKNIILNELNVQN